MMAAVPSMDVVEYFPALRLLDAALENTGDTALVELVVDAGEGLAAPLDHPSLSLVLREDLVLEVGEVRRCPVLSRLGDGDEGLVGSEWNSQVNLLWRED